MDTSRLPEPAPQGQDLAPRLNYPQKPSRTPSLPPCPLCGWVRRLAGRRRDAVRCQPMAKAVSGGGCAPLGQRWAPLSCSARPQARLQGSSSRAVCASAGPQRALAELSQPGGSAPTGASQTWRGPACLGTSRGQPARGTRLADSRRSRVRL